MPDDDNIASSPEFPGIKMGYGQRTLFLNRLGQMKTAIEKQGALEAKRIQHPGVPRDDDLFEALQGIFLLLQAHSDVHLQIHKILKRLVGE